MTITSRILDFASKYPSSFSRKDLMAFLASDANNVSEASAHVGLARLLNENKIIRVGYGKYQLADNSRIEFKYTLDSNLQELYRKIKEKFPFADVCIWKSTVFTPFMQHVPSTDIIFVDVEREVMESVFMYLQSFNIGVHIMLNPSKDECERYIINNECMIIRPLVKEAPLQDMGNYSAPTLEKLLVDAVADKELEYLRGNELYHIFNNAFARYNINEKRLFRYASRRNRKDKVKNILDSIQP